MAVSNHFRERVVEAVVLGGLSRNRAAAHFKVSIASAVRWVKRFKTTGEAPLLAPSGGDRRSGRIEAIATSLGLVWRSPDLTLLEIQQRLIGNCGERFAVSVLWRFFDRHDMTFKKRRMPRSNNGRTCKIDAGNGSPGKLDLDPTKLVFIDETGSFHQSRAQISGRCRARTRLRLWPSRTVTTKR